MHCVCIIEIKNAKALSADLPTDTVNDRNSFAKNVPTLFATIQLPMRFTPKVVTSVEACLCLENKANFASFCVCVFLPKISVRINT